MICKTDSETHLQLIEATIVYLLFNLLEILTTDGLVTGGTGDPIY